MSGTMKTIDTVFALATVLLGAFVIVYALDYGYTARGNPGPGFFPFWVGIGVVALGAVNAARAAAGREHLTESFDWIGLLRTAGIAAVIAAFLLTVDWTGMLIGIGLVVIALGFVIRPTLEAGFVLRLVATGLLFPFAAWLIFSFYLGIRLVTGVFGI
jgi:putative tricarboxylic transport membrane protein